MSGGVVKGGSEWSGEEGVVGSGGGKKEIRKEGRKEGRERASEAVEW